MYYYFFIIGFNLLLAIIVKPNSGNNEEQLLSVENHADLTKNFDSERSVRYIPQSPSSIYLSPTKHHQQQHERHHHLPLDNLNLVRVIFLHFINSFALLLFFH